MHIYVCSFIYMYVISSICMFFHLYTLKKAIHSVVANTYIRATQHIYRNRKFDQLNGCGKKNMTISWAARGYRKPVFVNARPNIFNVWTKPSISSTRCHFLLLSHQEIILSKHPSQLVGKMHLYLCHPVILMVQ